MVSLNKVLLVGNLTKDPELRYTPGGSAVVTLRLAVNRSFKDKNGQVQKDTCFVNIIVWGQMAEVCNQYLQKGRQVFVEGRLQSRSWQGSDGKTRSTIEVIASRVQFMPQAQQSARPQEQQVDLGEEPEEAVHVENTEVKESGEAI